MRHRTALTIGSFVLLMTLALPGLAAADFHVAPSGNNGNSGSAAAPFQTIGKACNVVQAGDTVWIHDGTYDENVSLWTSGRADAYITVKSENRWGARIVGSGGADGFKIGGDYIEVEGLELTNPGGHGFNGEDSHHIRIFNCHAYDCGNSGITGAWSDFYHFEGNVCNNNASLSWYSGISIYEAASIGDDSPGYHIIIRNNICYENFSYGGLHTDGNGIIIDDWNSTQNPGTPYPYGALVENNLCYDNGGAGVKVVWSDNVLVRNNTCFNNNLDLANTGTYRGEIYCQDSRNIRFINNIAYADPSVNSNNSACLDKGSPSGSVTTANRWVNNIFFNGSVGDSAIDLGDGSSPTMTGNLNGVDPGFVTAAARNFHLADSSLAIDAGTADYGYFASDLDGQSRPQGLGVDIGTYEFLADLGPTLRRIAISCSRSGFTWSCPQAATTSEDGSTTVFNGIEPASTASLMPMPEADD